MPFEITKGVDIPEGSYPATLERVESGKGNFGDFRTWHWLVEVNGNIESLRQFTSANTGPNSQSYKQLTALIGRPPQAGETIEDPTGSRVILQIGKNEKGYPKVTEVLPFVEPQQTIPGIPR